MKERKELEERIKLLEKLGGIIREESKAYGIIDAVWGVAVFVGFIIFQLIEIYSLPWYIGIAIIIASLAIAAIASAILRRRIAGYLGYHRGGWLGKRIRWAWMAIAFVGGTSFMLVFWSPSLSKILLNHINPRDISGLILTGWLIIDGIGCMVQGILSESKPYFIIGFLMAISAIAVSYIGFIYAWSAFALTFGLGYMVVGLRDYSLFKNPEV